VHRPRVDAVDALPGGAGVGGAVDAAVLVAAGALVILDVGGLAGVSGAVGPGRAARAGPAGAGSAGSPAAAGALAVGQLHGQLVLAAPHLQLDLVAGLGGSGQLQQAVVGLDRLVADLADHVARLEARLLGRAALGDVLQLGPLVVAGVLAAQAQVSSTR